MTTGGYSSELILEHLSRARFSAGRVSGQGFYVGSGHLITGGDFTNTETQNVCALAWRPWTGGVRSSGTVLVACITTSVCLYTGLLGDYTGGTVEERWDVIRAQQ